MAHRPWPMKMPRFPVSRRARPVLWLGFLLLSPALLWGCWNAPFFGLDDEAYLAHNRLLNSAVPWRALWRFHPGQNFYYPLTLLSWRLDRLVWEPLLGTLAGPNAWPAGIRIGNLGLHLLAAFFLWATFRRLRVPPAVNAFVVSAFALHPYACELVAWPIERKSVLAAAFGFAAWYLYLRAEPNSLSPFPRGKGERPSPIQGGRGRGVLGGILTLSGAALCYAAALLSKPSALGLFAVVVVWELLGRPRHASLGDREERAEHVDGAPSDTPAGKTRRSRWRLCSIGFRLAPWAALSALGIWLALKTHGMNRLPPPGGTLWTALLTDVVIAQRYFLNFFWPGFLSAYYPVEPVRSLADARLWSSAAALAVSIGGTLWLAEASARRLVLFAWLWFFGALGPHWNLIALNDLMHDRFVYLAAPGFWLAWGLGLHGAWRRLPSLKRRAPRSSAAVALGALALSWSLASAARSVLFADARRLWEATVAQEPQSSYAQLYLAAELKNEALRLRESGARGEAEAKAAALLTRARSAYEAGFAALDYERFLYKLSAHVDLAYLYYIEGRLDEARTQSLKALTYYHGFAMEKKDASKAMQILGMVDLKKDAPLRAIGHLDRALQMDPSRTLLHWPRAQALLKVYERLAQAGARKQAAAAKRAALAALRRVPETSPKHGAAQRLLKKLEAARQAAPPEAPAP